jgi:hypothetical protein
MFSSLGFYNMYGDMFPKLEFILYSRPTFPFSQYGLKGAMQCKPVKTLYKQILIGWQTSINILTKEKGKNYSNLVTPRKVKI